MRHIAVVNSAKAAVPREAINVYFCCIHGSDRSEIAGFALVATVRCSSRAPAMLSTAP